MNAGVLTAILLAFSIAPVFAQAPSQREKELAELEAQLKARAEEERRLKNEAEAREKEVQALRYRMVETANSLQQAEKRIAEIEEEIRRLDEEEATIAAALFSERENLGNVLAGLQSLEMSRPPALLVSPDNANKAARAAMLLATAAPALEARASALKISMESLARVRAERDRERTAFAKTNADITDRRAILAELLEKKLQERDVAASLALAAQRETAALAARATSLREVIYRLERLATAITPRLKPPVARPDMPAIAAAPRPLNRSAEVFKPARPFSLAKGALRPPVVGRLTGVFGGPKPEGGRFDGVRFAVRDQAIVTAPYEGNVAFARAWGPIGNLLVLDVGEGYHILMMGITGFLVQEGQRVTAGEPVGSVSTVEGNEESLVDLEIRRNGDPVNPTLWLSRQSVEEMAL